MMRSALLTPILAILCLAVPAAIFVPGWKAHSQVPKGIHESELSMRAYMVGISEQLGVTCNYCHDTRNFKSDVKRSFKVAKDHMRIVDLLYNDGFKTHVKVDCRMCHRGQAKPNFNLNIEQVLPKKEAEKPEKKK